MSDPASSRWSRLLRRAQRRALDQLRAGRMEEGRQPTRTDRQRWRRLYERLPILNQHPGAGGGTKGTATQARRLAVVACRTGGLTASAECADRSVSKRAEALLKFVFVDLASGEALFEDVDRGAAWG